MDRVFSIGVSLLTILLLNGCDGHGRLREPPSRGSMWRDGFPNPPNYNDNELNCGGAGYQWDSQDGKCGICGDPYDGKKLHEAGGKYANGIIGRTYTEGATIDVTLQITAQHKGWFEFRICPTNNVKKRATQECLDKQVLEVVDSQSRYRYNIPEGDKPKTYKLQVRLPQGVTCTQCVFQWKWNTGNSWGTDPDGTECVGCGAQEQFYGCSDIAITSNSGIKSGKSTTTDPPNKTTEIQTTKQVPSSTTVRKTSTSTVPPIKSTPKTTDQTTTTTIKTTTDQNNGVKPVTSGCRALKWFKPQGGDTYCKQNCPNHCPASHCICGAAKEPSCKPTVAYINVSGMQFWCDSNCAAGNCLRTHCICD